ncbi:MAG: hypothetical protein IH623_20040 [Verrucomicrobia bacterium]|nr:hypothetical protein [Verrucomicrobiota bacterium]
MNITATKHGLRLSQHGVVISELRATPGPTHSVFDVLAALVATIAPKGRIGILGFAGGGMMAPLDALGLKTGIDSVDLDRASYDLFCRHCPDWSRRVNWHHAEAATWLRQQPPNFGLLLDDLSVPCAGDVVKPAISWNGLPALIRRRLQPDGIAVFNLLPLPSGGWQPELQRLAGQFKDARIIVLDDFDNRILVAGSDLPSAHALGRRLRQALRQIRSRQADRIHLRQSC